MLSAATTWPVGKTASVIGNVSTAAHSSESGCTQVSDDDDAGADLLEKPTRWQKRRRVPPSDRQGSPLFQKVLMCGDAAVSQVVGCSPRCLRN